MIKVLLYVLVKALKFRMQSLVGQIERARCLPPIVNDAVETIDDVV